MASRLVTSNLFFEIASFTYDQQKMIVNASLAEESPRFQFHLGPVEIRVEELKVAIERVCEDPPDCKKFSISGSIEGWATVMMDWHFKVGAYYSEGEWLIKGELTEPKELAKDVNLEECYIQFEKKSTGSLTAILNATIGWTHADKK